MTLEEKVKASAEELRTSGHPEDAERLERDIEYVSKVWADSPADVFLADDLGDLLECLQRMLAILGRHVTV
ncbi:MULTISPECIES: hypothetical protein [Amycolatopsis]|nr:MULTISPECIES: hypothetical protein [Amycolatopsis]AXB41323.1 hypothetical protein A4R43_01300 [Amycolatopsis albispora]